MGIKIAFSTRKEAREFAKQHKGKVRDCSNRPYLSKRWTVVI